MGTKEPISGDIMAREKESGDAHVQLTVELDAGALFVLKSRGLCLFVGSLSCVEKHF